MKHVDANNFSTVTMDYRKNFFDGIGYFNFSHVSKESNSISSKRIFPITHDVIQTRIQNLFPSLIHFAKDLVRVWPYTTSRQRKMKSLKRVIRQDK